MVESEKSQPLVWRLLAGLQAGIGAAAIMAGWLALENLITRHAPWYAPNVFATSLLAWSGPDFGRATIVGYALVLVVAGLSGVLFGLVVPPRIHVLWGSNLGIALALAWYWLAYRRVMGGWNALLVTALTPGEQLLAHFLFGAGLGLYPLFYRRLSRPI